MVTPEYVKGSNRVDAVITLRDSYSHYGIICNDQREFRARIYHLTRYNTIVIEYDLTNGTLHTAILLDCIEKICPVGNHAA